MSNKNDRYKRLYEQLALLLSKPGNPLARMATINAILYHKMADFFWVGFYLFDGDDLIAGPYQGPVACQLLEQHKGVCWTVLDQRKTIIVPDVHQFPGHIACDSRSNSEIAVPLMDGPEIKGVLDIDSKGFNAFDTIDQEWLKKITYLVYHPQGPLAHN